MRGRKDQPSSSAMTHFICQDVFKLHSSTHVALSNHMCNYVNLQGPPGTGKSYMGLQLLRLFLSMKHAATGKLVLENKPALVMAYKNRALDHFILECASFCHLDHIVRIGHASDGYEDQLKPVLLRERVMTALPREGTITLRERLNSLYDRFALNFRLAVLF